MEQSVPHVPREYRALYSYLDHRYASVVVLTFEQIEALLGFALPGAARTRKLPRQADTSEGDSATG